MKGERRNILLFFFILSISFYNPLQAQQEDLKITPFRLIVTVTEYANALAGDMEYTLTENKLDIVHISIINNIKGLVVSQKLTPDRILKQFSDMDLGIFDSFYGNDKIMMTSGQAISVTYEKGNSIKQMFFHCYYSKLFRIMADQFNTLIPKDYKIDVCMIL